MQEWAPQIANSWRTVFDISYEWESILSSFRKNQQHASKAKPGAWNDPDMMEIGVGNLTLEEERSHFSIWAMSKAPMLLGCDFRNISLQSI